MYTILLIIIIVLVFSGLFVLPKKKKEISFSGKDLTMQEKYFYLSLASQIPQDYMLVYQKDIIDFKSLARKKNINKAAYLSMKKSLKQREIDFVILDKDLEICCVVDCNSKGCKIIDNEFKQACEKLDIPIFDYINVSKPVFSKLVDFLEFR